MSYSTTISKLVGAIFRLSTNQIDRFLISSVLKPHVVYSYCARCHLPVNYDTKQFADTQILSMMKLERQIPFTNHWPKSHCDNKASIETPREQSVIVTSQLPVAG